MASIPPISSAHDPCRRQQQQYSSPHLHLPISNALLLITATLLIILAHIPSADAALRNATIDDTLGDELTGRKPLYVPSMGSWDGVECARCMVEPDPALAFQHTYTAATYRKDEGTPLVEFSFQFTGSALYVFLTLAHNRGEGIVTLTETNFTIDDGPPVFFRHTPDMTRTDFDYQYPAFVQENLEHGPHTFRAKTSGPDYHIFVNFDYATYTYDDTLVAGSAGAPSASVPTTGTATSSSSTSTSSTTSSSSSNTDKNSIAGPIAGGVVGALAVAAIFIYGILLIRQRARRAPGTGHAGFGGGGREYPDPEILASSASHLNDTRYVRTDGANASITPFTYTSPAGGSGTHSLSAQTQGSSHASGSGSQTLHTQAPYRSGRGSGRGRGGTAYAQPVRKDRITGTGASDSTGPTDMRTVGAEPLLPAYTISANPQSVSSHQHSHSHSNPEGFGAVSGSGSSRGANPAGGIEESVHAMTGVRLEPMQSRTSQTSSHSTGRGVAVPPAPTAAGGTPPRNASPPSNPDAQMDALQDSIRLLIANLQSEREALTASGMSGEAVQNDEGLTRKTETLRRMAEQMSLLQERGSEVPIGARAERNGERHGSTTTHLPPGYDSGVATS